MLRHHCNHLESSRYEYVPLMRGEHAKAELEELVKLLKVSY